MTAIGACASALVAMTRIVRAVSMRVVFVGRSACPLGPLGEERGLGPDPVVDVMTVLMAAGCVSLEGEEGDLFVARCMSHGVAAELLRQ